MERFVEDRMAAHEQRSHAQGNAATAFEEPDQVGLRRQDTVDWRDTNMALFGSEVEYKIKENAAASESAWRGAGTVKGLLIWRIEKFKVVEWPVDKHGTFYTGDSYIFLNTKQGEQSQNWYTIRRCGRWKM